MATHPPYTASEAQSRETFLALMWALSYPGRTQSLPDHPDPFALIGETLLDLETSYFTPDAQLRARLAQTGARALEPERAAYHFYPALDDAALAAIASASIGTLSYPDQAATLIIGAQFGSGKTLTLTGPGIDGSIIIQIDDIPASFWMLRERAAFPLGWDVFFVNERAVVGLPRSTKVTLANE
ncbi:MAG: phosphonate C-P lyase system protein PhnH [Phototrophicales bacterium]|nr:MAG: phosphonate C-P lyase system protein PhnH [Phototrophicales bacterium]